MIETSKPFPAVDKHGNQYELVVETEFCNCKGIDASTGVELIQRIPDRKRLQTADGTMVQRLSQGKYLLLGVEEVELTSDHPDAV